MGLRFWGALHKIGRFRNVPTVGTFVNEFNFNLLINVPMVGTFVIKCKYVFITNIGAF